MPEQMQDALDRLERNLDAKIIERDGALQKLIEQRLTDHERRLGEMNNAHEKALEAKRLTDESATRIQERIVTKDELEKWKGEVNKRLDLAAGAAKTWALLGAVAGSVIAGIFVGIISRFLFPSSPVQPASPVVPVMSVSPVTPVKP